MVLMTNASQSGQIMTDYTTQSVVNNLYRLGYFGCDIANIFSRITTKVSTKDGVESLYTVENLEQIQKSAAAAENEVIVIAWGSLGDNNKKTKAVQEKILDILRPHADKLYVISDKDGKKEQYHPLAAPVRDSWVLKPFVLPEKEPDNKTANEQSKGTK